MLTENIAADHRAQSLWKRYLRSDNLSSAEKEKLKGFRMCGSRVIKQQGVVPAVFVVKTTHENNEASTHLFGNAHCHSAWACPYCTARVMAARSVRIAAAIEALEAQNQWATMITFTIPHTPNMYCEETFQILKLAWRHFIRGANIGYETRTYTKKDGTTSSYRIKRSVYGAMREELKIRHCVRVYEFTWGKNNWHPHIHALYWAPKENFAKIADYESELNASWFRALKHCAKKYWKQINPDLSNDELEKKSAMLFDSGNRDKHNGVTISKNPDGTTRRVRSSEYISGWGSDKEVTRTDLKKASDGHYTPHQIINNAMTAKNSDEEIKWLKLFTEYALATRGSRRVEISNSGLNKIIDEWIKSHPQVTQIQKKTMSPVVTAEIVCWFTSEQWWLICNLVEPEVFDIKALILERARLPDGKEQVTKLLLDYGIDISGNPRHKEEDLVASIYAA